MRKRFPLTIALSVILCSFLGSGCAIHELRNVNRRLKGANDRLVSENNRLEQELAAAEREVVDKNTLIDKLRTELEKPSPGAVANASGPQKLPPLPEFPDVETRYTPQGILMRIDQKILFATGRASLSSKGRSVLTSLSQTLNSSYGGHLIRVEVHTDDVPVKRVKNQYPSNWELSTARACTVVRHLVEQGHLSPHRVYPAGFAEYKPVISGRTSSARQKNRRVEILILNERV